MRGLTQEQFAELVHISRGYLSHIEAPNVISSFSIAILFDIADTLDIETKLLLEFN
ncbi:MAG: helix-turn-helix domain-containing protein [Oscillospiraceae bacterium]|jgi:transcriptional regulator with XRE-family HTH domain|nr:helix-turn-helix domain-containing protein [Oscillospiraceae bacterium]